jgi:hypothetical protein
VPDITGLPVNKLAYLTLSAVLGVPALPFLPLLPDFMMVVARSRT